jgi:hypothetical protein
MQVKSGVSISIKTGESNMNRIMIALMAACIVLVSLTGCQESEGSDTALIQRARLVGNENLQLKKQLEEKDQLIAQLKENIEQLEIDKAEAARKAGDANFRIMQIVAETEKRNEALTQENEKLKNQLEELKSQQNIEP